MRNTVRLTDTELIVTPRGLDRLWSFTRELRIPLDEVRGATHDPGVQHEPKGFRAPGLRAFGKLSGTFHRDGRRQFWNVAGWSDVVVITLGEDSRYDRLYLSVDDPRGVESAINTAVATRRTR